MIMGSHHLIFIFIFIFIFINLISQTSSAACNGIYITYTYKSGLKLPPNTTLQSSQPYRFESTATILNNALQPLKSWQLFVGFHNKELLVSASQAVLVDGSTFPAHVGNGTVFAGFPATDLNTAVDTAGDLTQMMANIDFVGTQFGVNPPNVPMPLNISLLNNGFSCPSAVQNGTFSSFSF
ncbi:hypothetical protein GIB67_035129 [Kingdonia uniflora]|uniref:Uncharacterized protein n=1 Tax=Kingdonia uniflora TaxID=39325 RepID=A0A7J7NW00_9MAGN|nr:hypothetical protein GIB67_035129 [Kingdonia uniflora]